MSQQYPPDDTNQPWNNPQQPYQQGYNQQPSEQPWNNPQQSGPGQPWNNPQQPYQQGYNQQPSEQPFPPQQPYYPPQQPMYQQPPKKRLLWPWFVGGGCLILVLVTCGVLFALGVFAAKNVQTTIPNIQSTVQSAAQSAGTPVSVSAHHKLNEAVSVNDTWQVTVTKISTYQGNTISTPAAGNAFVQLAISVKNISTKQQIAASLIQFNLHDASGQKYTENLFGGTAGLDGTVAPGASLKGTITYEVPATTKSFVLDFSPDFSGHLTSWDLEL